MVFVAKGLAGCLFLLWIAACAAPGAPPQGVRIALTSSVETRPYTAEELAHPAMRQMMELCKTGGWGDCDTRTVPVDDRNEFDRTVDGGVNIFIELTGLQPDSIYRIELKVYNPNGDLTGRVSLSRSTPRIWQPLHAIQFLGHWAPVNQASWQLGRWRIEVFVNGRLEVERSFDVVGDLAGSGLDPIRDFGGAFPVAQ